MGDDKPDPPPPYPPPSSFPFGPWMKTTTTTKVTTTTTETHFFPLFGRRSNARAPDETAAGALRRSIDNSPGTAQSTNDMGWMKTRIREKALPAPPSNASSDGLGIGTPPGRRSLDRDITPRASDRDITPTAPVPVPVRVIVPATSQAVRTYAARDIRRIRSSGTLRDTHPDFARYSEQTERHAFLSLSSKPLPPPLSAPPLPESNRQPAVSSPSLFASSSAPRQQGPFATRRTLSPHSAGHAPQASILNTGQDQVGPGLNSRPTTVCAGHSSAAQGWSGWQREQGRLAWESQAEFGMTGQVAVHHSLGARGREPYREREKERERRPSAPAVGGGTLFAQAKGKGKDHQRDASPDPPREKEKDKEGGKRSILSRRPSFWMKRSKAKDVAEGRLSAAGTAPNPSLGGAADVFSADPKRSLDASRAGPSQPSRVSDASRPSSDAHPRQSTNSNISAPPRPSTHSEAPSRQSADTAPDVTLPAVRPMTPLFSEFGVYRASVDFAAAGGPSMMAALAEQLAGAPREETIVEDVETTAAEPEPFHTPSSPIAIANSGTNTPPRRRLTNTSSLGRPASWRRSLVESAEGWRRSLIGSPSGLGDDVEQVLTGSPVRTASSSPVPWVSISTSPRASPVPGSRSGSRASGRIKGKEKEKEQPRQGRGSVSRKGSPGRSKRNSPGRSGRGSPGQSGRGSPARGSGVTSPVGGARVTFGDEPERARFTSLVPLSMSGRGGAVNGAGGPAPGGSTAAAGGDHNGPRRSRSTSRLTAAFSPSRRRSFSLFGPRPSSAGQPRTTTSEQQPAQPTSRFRRGSSAQTVTPSTDPGLTLSLSPLMLGPGHFGASGAAGAVPTPQFGPGLSSQSGPGTPFQSTPGTPLFTQPSGSQLSLGGGSVGYTYGYGGSSTGHSAYISSPGTQVSSSGMQSGSSNLQSNSSVAQSNASGSHLSSSTYIGSPGGSRASSILLRSPLRPRSSTNPPLLRRLSGVFGSAGGAGRNASGLLGEGGPGIGGMSPLVSGAGLSVGGANEKGVGASRPTSSKGPSPSVNVARRTEADTPEVFLVRLLEGVSKTEIAGALASKGDDFHVAALQLYMRRFNFVFDPLDIALRRLLMDLCLPKETQQIDRVMEAFAKRYAECNPGLFVSEDHAYILAFSLMMLHTDAFNKSNKNKMTKADYVKNTRMGGIPPEVLDCFFDNIVFAPFIFIEDPTDVNGQRGFVPDSLGVKGSISGGGTSSNNSSTLLASKPKIDPYFIITQNLLDPLRVPVDQYIPPASPFSFTGTADSLDPGQLRRAFVSNTQLEIAGTGAEPVRIGVNKSGLLTRKDDLLEGGRRAGSRKWRRWAVVLTGSQLLFFREASWALLVSSATDNAGSTDSVAQTSSLKPEEVVSLKDAIALYDVSYGKYTNVFRFAMPTGRQQLMQAANEQDMNEWIARINYASALKSAGVRVRELVMNAEESRATGVAAAVSHVRDRRLGKVPTPPTTASPWTDDQEGQPQNPQGTVSSRTSENRSNVSSEVELDAVVEATDGGMKDTFDNIKAELAASHHNTFPRSGLAPPRQGGYRAMSLGGQRPSPSLSSLGINEDGTRTRMTTRAEVVTSKITDLDSKINTTQLHLQNEVRVARNFAVLAPFQQATRTRIRFAVEALARRIQVVRMDMAKMACHRSILVDDLAAEEKEREHLRTVALEAARQQLLLSVPRMTLSVHDDVPEEDVQPERRPSPAGSEVSASAAWSFHSGTDYPDPAEDPTLTADRNNTSLTTPEIETEQLALTPPRKSDNSLRPRPSFAASSRSGVSRASSSGNVNNATTTEPVSNSAAATEEETEEQAEAWHATRAGRRVSLVQLPPTPEGRKFLDLFKKRTSPDQAIGEGTDNEVVA